MNVKQYLGQLTWLNRRIQNKLTEVYQLRVMITSATSIPIENDKIIKTKRTDVLGDTIAKILDKETEIDMLVDSYIEKRDTIISQIDSMDDIDNYHILSMRYVGGLSFPKIATAAGWSLSQTKRLHNKALSAFDARYGDIYKAEKLNRI